MNFIGCVPFSATGPGFGLPLFQSTEGSKQKFSQRIDEITDRISGFDLVDADSFTSASLDVTAEVGSEKVYSFVDEKGCVHAGTIKMLEPTLRAFLARCPNYPGILLQIAELAGSTEERRSARVRMSQTIASSAGGEAGRGFFLRSAALTDTWKLLIQNATDDTAAVRILANRSKVEVIESPDGSTKIDLKAIPTEDYSIEPVTAHIKNIEASVAREPTLISDHQKLADHVPDKVWDAVREIEHARTQEQRIAIVLDELAKNPIVGTWVLSFYTKEKGKYATRILAAARDASRISSERGHPDIISTVRDIVELSYQIAYPMSRGKLLAQFAIYLAKYPVIGRQLLNYARSSSAMDIVEFRAFIEACIELPPKEEEYEEKQAEFLDVRKRIPRVYRPDVYRIESIPELKVQTDTIRNKSLDEIRRRAATAPEQSVLLLARELEENALKAIAIRGRLQERKSLSLTAALKELEDYGFPRNLIESLEQFQKTRNAIAHNAYPDHQTLLQDLDSGSVVLEALKMLPGERNTVYREGIELFEDEHLEKPILDARGVILATKSPGGFVESHRIFPTTKSYFKKGMELSWEWNMQRIWQETWYLDPDTTKIRKGWVSSAEFVGRDLAQLYKHVRITP
jgi:hypothetical protein